MKCFLIQVIEKFEQLKPIFVLTMMVIGNELNENLISKNWLEIICSRHPLLAYNMSSLIFGSVKALGLR